MSEILAERLIFSGTVQGVGFRRRTVAHARNFPVCGYVRNLGDGRVELYVEGPQKAVQPFIAVILDELKTFIRDYERHSVGPLGCSDFQILGT